MQSKERKSQYKEPWVRQKLILEIASQPYVSLWLNFNALILHRKKFQFTDPIWFLTGKWMGWWGIGKECRSRRQVNSGSGPTALTSPLHSSVYLFYSSLQWRLLGESEAGSIKPVAQFLAHTGHAASGRCYNDLSNFSPHRFQEGKLNSQQMATNWLCFIKPQTGESPIAKERFCQCEIHQINQNCIQNQPQLYSTDIWWKTQRKHSDLGGFLVGHQNWLFLCLWVCPSQHCSLHFQIFHSHALYFVTTPTPIAGAIYDLNRVSWPGQVPSYALGTRPNPKLTVPFHWLCC